MAQKLSILELETIRAEEIKSITDSKGYKRLSEKTQVMVPDVGREDIVMTRGSHTDAVVHSARSMLVSMAEMLGLSSMYDIDYRYSIDQACLLHDIGHPPFGHDGAEKIDTFVRTRGLQEGFNDNNNNIVIIESNNMKVRDEVVADTIKYPKKLYKAQAEKYLPVLSDLLKQDKEHFKKLGINLKNQTRTIACQLMDEADRNTYTCDDMSDYFRVVNKSSIKFTDMLSFIKNPNERQTKLLSDMVQAVNSGSNTEIRNFFNNIKAKFNENWKITENGIDFINNDLEVFREALSDMTRGLYIEPLREKEFHQENMKKLELFLVSVFDGEYNESNYYNKKIKEATNKEEVLECQRDTVADVSDHFLMNHIAEQMDKLVDKNNIVLKSGRNRVKGMDNGKR